ncbi:sodium/nucleoside cotransporter 1-like [Pollicipes pollicipes]|uniref:sodium/nucleoside cotransporter 1-like n=1 Tax=Pollicipes pollicipes TaxID=41117 RepID=UPI0018856681|nr:sodium/nucleoside cotransporter 1-like [Pollicipes pollicipes]
MRKHKRQLRWLAFLAWITYVIYVQIYSFYIMEQDYDACNGGGLVAWVSAVILLYIMLFRLILPHIHHVRRLKRSICIRPFECCRVTCQYTLVRLATCAIVFVLIVMLTHQGRFVPSTHQCIALSGYFAIILIAYFLSVEPEKIDWRLVIKNLLIQIIIVYSMMIWTFGRVLLQCTAEKITVFFSFSKEAAAVVFSDQLPHMLAIELLCTLTLTGCYMHILYYLGILQSFFHKLGFILEMITGATAVEAICAALCTLCGGVEAAVVLEPYIVLLTMSELHTFIVSGFAFMTGVTLSLYMSLGIDQVNLMTANFATCSGVLALSKIVYPETDRSVTTYKDLKFLDRDEYNLVDAAVRGATAIIKVLVNVISGLIAMVSVVNMSNTFVGWVLENIGIPGMDIIGILSFISRPLIFLMGVEWQYSDKVARLFIIKTVKNENFAYRAFSKLQQTDPIPMREQAVTTALLYGYSNIAHIGVITALMTVLAPERRQDISITVMRAMFTSVLVNMLTASVIGALVTPHDLKLAQNVTNLNVSAHWTR